MNDFLENCRAYEIYPVSFCDSDGDGLGDINGIISKLDYLAGLAVNLIWVNPFFKGEFKDAGYDISDYYDIDPRFGTLADVERLIAEAKKRGIRLMFDLVMGHTSDRHPWFIESQKEEKNEFSDRYIWSDGTFSRGDYTYLAGLSERSNAYMVNYYASQPALNYGFKKIKNKWEMSYDDPVCMKNRGLVVDVVKFWLKKGVAGFRVDMAGDMVKRDPSKAGNITFWRDVLGQVKAEYPEAIFLAEWNDPDKALKRAGFDMANLYLGDLMEVYNTDACNGKYFSSDGKGFFRNFLFGLRWFLRRKGKDSYGVIMPSCHDHGRMNHGQSVDMLKSENVLMRTITGVFFDYMGDEIGILRRHGLKSKDAGYERTPARTPMQWDGSKNAGFSSADEIYLPVDGVAEHSVEAQLKDENSLLNLVKKLNHMRRDYDCFHASAKLKIVRAGVRGYPLLYKREGRNFEAYIAVSPTDKGAMLKNKAFLCEPADSISVNCEIVNGALKLGAQASAVFVYKKQN